MLKGIGAKLSPQRYRKRAIQIGMGRLSANRAESEYHQIPRNLITAHLYARDRGIWQIWLHLRFPAGCGISLKRRYRRRKKDAFPTSERRVNAMSNPNLYSFSDPRDWMYNLMAHALIGQLSNDLHGVRAEIQYVRKELLAMREESGANRGQQEALDRYELQDELRSVLEELNAVTSDIADVGREWQAACESGLKAVREELEAHRAQIEDVHNHLEAMRNMLEDIVYQVPYWAFDLQALRTLEEHKQGVRVVSSEDGHARVVEVDGEGKNERTSQPLLKVIAGFSLIHLLAKIHPWRTELFI